MKVEVESQGQEAGGNSIITMNGKKIYIKPNRSGHQRGMNLVIIEPNTNKVIHAQAYDHWGRNKQDAEDFGNKLADLPKDMIVAVGVADDGSTNLDYKAKLILGTMGSSVASLGFRESWAFIGVKGEASQVVEMKLKRGEGNKAYVAKEFILPIEESVQK